MKPINLNQARKAKAKIAAKATADENAVRFGRTKAQRRRDAAEAEKVSTRLSQLKLGDD